MESLKYLERCRDLTETRSDYALAKLLGIAENAVNRYRTGERVMDDYACLRVAQVLDVPLDEVIAAANYDREKDEKKKLEWARHLRKWVPLCGVALFHFGLGVSLATAQGLNSVYDLLQIMRPLVRRTIRAWFARFPALRAPSGPGCPAMPSPMGL